MSVADRILGNLEKLVRSFVADLGYAKAWSYTVTEADDATFSGRALSPACPQPDLPKIPNMPGVPGTLLRPAVGSVVAVAFLDGDPAKPRVVSWDSTAAEVVRIVTAASGASNRVDFTPDGLVVSPVDSPAPQPQAVALAPAVQSLADASTTLATATSVFTAALGVIIPIAAPTPPQLLTFATAVTTYTTAITVFTSAVAALGGTFPTGFAATKTTTR